MNESEIKQGPGGELEAVVEKLVYGGQGLARIESRVALIPFVAPGERVRIRVEAERRGIMEARLVEVIEPAPGRVDPPCPFFYRCGGCQYQHLGYEAQVNGKRAILAEVFRRVGKLEPPAEIHTIAGEPWGYRNRVQLHLEDGETGYFSYGSRRLTPVDRCPISSPKINETLAALREMQADRRFPDFIRSIELFTNEREIDVNVAETERPVARRFFEWCAERIPGLASGEGIDYEAAGAVFRVRRRSFFQVNRFLLDPMVEAALEGAGGGEALDLYAGVGFFSLPLARRVERVTAVESSSSAAGDLEFNAQRAGAAVSVVRQGVEAYLEALDKAPEFALADPPRAGLGKRVVRELLRLRPKRLVVVACDPATLARDLAALVAGGYRIERVTLIDLFPQTLHIETIVHLG